MRARFLTALPVLLCFSAAVSAAPLTPVVTMPVSGYTTYNSRPWIRFTVNKNTCSGNVDHILVRIDPTTCSNGGTYNKDSNSSPSTFYPLPTAAGTVTHRLTSALGAGTYKLCVYAYCDGAGAPAWSTSVTFTYAVPSWSDGATVSAGSTKIRAVHFTELHDAIQNVRNFYGASAYSWTDYPETTLKKVRAVHMTDLRTALCGAYAAATGSACSLTFTDTPSTSVKIRAVHINELRSKVLLP